MAKKKSIIHPPSKSPEKVIIQKTEDYSTVILAITLGIVSIIFLYIRYTQLTLPLDRDEGSLLYSGYSLLHGKIPYVDFYEIKPPGIFLIYALFHLLFGYGNEALHIGLVMIQLSIAFLMYKTAYRIFASRNSGYMAAVLFLVLCMNPYFLSFAVMSEFFLILFLLGSILPLVKNKDQINTRDYIVSGLCIGMAAMIRQHTIFFAIPYLMFLMNSIGWNSKLARKPVLYVMIGAISIVLPLILYVASRGALDDMYYWIWQRPNESFMNQITFNDGKVHMISFLTLMGRMYKELLWIFLSGLIYLLIKPSEKTVWSIILPIFLTFSIGTVFPGNRFYGHYWILVFPALILIGCAAALIPQRTRSYKLRYALLAIIPVLITIHIFRNKDSFFPVSKDGLYMFIYGDNPNYTLHNLTKYLKNRIKKGEEVFVFGSEPQVYYECRSIPSTRHSYIATVHVPGSTNIPYQEEVMQYLQSRKPEYIMHVQYAHSIYMTDESSRKLYNWIFSFEENNYDVIALVEEHANRQIRYLYEKDAAAYTPTTSKYIILYRRKS